MPGREFDAVVRTEGEDTVVRLHGDVNRGAESGLGRASTEAESGPGRLLLDFTDVDYINSTGIALIVGVLAQAQAKGRSVAAYGLTEHYRELFQITRLSDFMHIYDNADAVSAAGN
jgi:anti-anti-sigma factor